MTIPVSPLLDTGLPTALSGEGASSPERLQEVVREFEALFIHQMLRSMRESSEWLGDDEDELFGARLIETIDVELARQLAESGGLGLAALLTPSLFGPEGNPLTGFAPGAATAAAQSPLDAEPLLSDRVTSEFGFRNDPLAGDHRFHAGVDLRAAYGREIGAAGSGQVVFAGEQGGYGLTVVIEHGSGVRTRYAHLSSTAVAEGDSVDAREPIGRAGDSGRATGSHLHFEIVRDGERVDPATIEGGLDGLLKTLRLAAD